MKKHLLLLCLLAMSSSIGVQAALITIKNELNEPISIFWKDHFLYPYIDEAKVLEAKSSTTLFITRKSLAGPLTVIPKTEKANDHYFEYKTKSNSYFLPLKKWHIKGLEIKRDTSGALKIRESFPKKKSWVPMVKKKIMTPLQTPEEPKINEDTK